MYRTCGGGEGRSGTVGGRSPGCFFWVSPKRSIPKPDPHTVIGDINIPTSQLIIPVLFSGFTDTNPINSLDGHTFRLAFANMRQVTNI